MKAAVLLAVRGQREGELAAAIDAHPGLSVARRCADLGEALAAAQAGIGDVVVVSEHPHLNRASIAEFEALGVAVVGAPASPDAAHHFLALGMADVILPGQSGADAALVVAVAAEQSAPTQPAVPAPRVPAHHLGKIVAVWGPHGAPGRTTIAVNLAAELATPTGNALVVDVDTYGGAVAQALGLLDEAPGLAALARASLNGILTDDVVVRHALQAAPGLRVLSGMTRADRWPELSRAALDPVWHALRSHAEVTVVDCGFAIETDEVLAYDTRAPQRNGATLSALSAADIILVVGTCEPLGIQRLVHALGALDDVGDASGTRVVVVNRLRASVAGARPREAVADALARYANVERTWLVPFDAKACDSATLAGQTLGERAPRSAVRRAIAELADHIAAALSSAPAVSPGRASATLTH